MLWIDAPNKNNNFNIGNYFKITIYRRLNTKELLCFFLFKSSSKINREPCILFMRHIALWTRWVISIQKIQVTMTESWYTKSFMKVFHTTFLSFKKIITMDRIIGFFYSSGNKQTQFVVKTYSWNIPYHLGGRYNKSREMNFRKKCREAHLSSYAQK